MKKALISIITILSLLAVIIFFAACTTLEQTAATMSTAIASSAAAETTSTAAPAESSTESSAEEKISSNFEILYIPKLADIPWFNVIKSGLEQCARDYGFRVTVVAPPAADPALQSQIILDSFNKGIDAIVVCPIDSAGLDPVLARANQAGIMTFSNEGYTLKNVTFDIEAMSNQAFGEAMMKAAVRYAGGNANYMVSVGFLEAMPQEEWADFEIAYQQKSAPGLKNLLGYSKGTDRFEDNEDSKIATTKITDYIQNNKDLNLIIGNSITTGPAAGEIISKQKLKGKLFYVGTGYPVTIGQYIRKDIIQEGFFYDLYLIGYATGYIAFQSWMGNIPEAKSSVLKPDKSRLAGYESLDILTNSNGGKIIFGNAIASITKENIEVWYKKFADYGWPQE
ncbi:MAG: substrate-binding domain-containing protein [Actinobacteria bacterium]|nr:substrate-binding domain-containing protein [Actinomycetota bacterium]MCG2789316.1 substrate-binding domain-containing protein [Actinomycetes bacterium]